MAAEGPLRLATAADADGIVALLQEMAEEGTLALDPGALDPASEARHLAALDLRREAALVAEVGGAVAGVALGVRAPAPATAHVGLVAVAVRAAARRRGLGRLLLGGVEAWARSAGLRKLAAEVLATNEPALYLFARAGYVVEGRRTAHVAVGDRLVDEVLLGRLLAPTGTGRSHA